MYEEIMTFLLNPPARMKAVGAFLSGMGMVLIVLGMYLRIDLAVVDFIQGMTKVNVGDATFLYPGFPTWFIPESTLGFIFCTIVLLLGAYTQVCANHFERIYRLEA